MEVEAWQELQTMREDLAARRRVLEDRSIHRQTRDEKLRALQTASSQRRLESRRRQMEAAKNRNKRIMEDIREIRATVFNACRETPAYENLRRAKGHFHEHVQEMLPVWHEQLMQTCSHRMEVMEKEKHDLHRRRQLALQAFEKEKVVQALLEKQRRELARTHLLCQKEEAERVEWRQAMSAKAEAEERALLQEQLALEQAARATGPPPAKPSRPSPRSTDADHGPTSQAPPVQTRQHNLIQEQEQQRQRQQRQQEQQEQQQRRQEQRRRDEEERQRQLAEEQRQQQEARRQAQWLSEKLAASAMQAALGKADADAEADAAMLQSLQQTVVASEPLVRFLPAAQPAQPPPTPPAPQAEEAPPAPPQPAPVSRAEPPHPAVDAQVAPPKPPQPQQEQVHSGGEGQRTGAQPRRGSGGSTKRDEVIKESVEASSPQQQPTTGLLTPPQPVKPAIKPPPQEKAKREEVEVPHEQESGPDIRDMGSGERVALLQRLCAEVEERQGQDYPTAPWDGQLTPALLRLERGLAASGQGQAQPQELACLVVLHVVRYSARELVPLELLNGLVDEDKVMKHHRKSGRALDLFVSLVKHVRRLVEPQPSGCGLSPERVCDIFADQLVGDMSKRDRAEAARIRRKMVALLESVCARGGQPDEMGGGSGSGSSRRTSRGPSIGALGQLPSDQGGLVLLGARSRTNSSRKLTVTSRSSSLAMTVVRLDELEGDDLAEVDDLVSGTAAQPISPRVMSSPSASSLAAEEDA